MIERRPGLPHPIKPSPMVGETEHDIFDRLFREPTREDLRRAAVWLAENPPPPMSRRQKLRLDLVWWWREVRERVALWVAPWLNGGEW